MSTQREELRQRRPVSNREEYDFYTAVTFLLIGLGGGLLLHSLLTPHPGSGTESSRVEL